MIDAVVGPWWLPVVAPELRPTGIPVDYVVLRAPLDQTLRRARERPDAEKFSAEEVGRRAAGGFHLDLAGIRGRSSCT